VRIFKTKPFARFAKRERLEDGSLLDAVSEIERGLVDADLGGGVLEKRVARPGEGKRGVYRMLIAVRASHRAIFMFGFAKIERDNIDDNQLATLREAAAYWLTAEDDRIERAIEDENLIEVPRYE
jgi:hypothetical protein